MCARLILNVGSPTMPRVAGCFRPSPLKDSGSMLKNTRFLFGLTVALVASAAFATHPVDPLALTQKNQGNVLAVGASIPPGSNIDLYADVDGQTCGGNYVMQYELISSSGT